MRRERKRIAFSLPSIASSFADYIFNAYRENGGRAKGESEAFNLGFSLLDPYSDDSYLRDVTVLPRERQLSDFPLCVLVVISYDVTPPLSQLRLLSEAGLRGAFRDG